MTENVVKGPRSQSGDAPSPGAGCYLNIDKPQDWTSTDVVRKLKGVTKSKKIGHGGTLDPIATGVLPICIGPATRFAETVLLGTKGYRITIELGSSTDTYDSKGTTTAEGDWANVTRDQVASVLENFRGEAPFSAWIFRIATFRCTDHLRRKKPQTTELAEEIPDDSSTSNPVSGFKTVRSNAEIVRMLARLPRDQRHVVELKFFQNFTFEEIAAQLGISSNTAKSRLYAALKKLKETKEAGAIAC